MHITLFGATGRTGRLVLEQALQAGHSVAALVRADARLDPVAPLMVLRGSIHAAGDVERAIRGADAVLSVLGPVENKPLYEISRAMPLVVQAMQRSGVKRLVVTSGAGVRDRLDRPGAVDRLFGALVKRMAAHVYEDMRRTVEIVRASGLDWTIVRVPMLVDGPRSARVRVGYVGKGTGPRLSRADLAAFVVKQITDTAYICQAPVVSN